MSSSATHLLPRSQKILGRNLSLVALLVMGATFILLLLVNFVYLNAYQQAGLTRVQQSLEDHARGISYFLSERENDIRTLALSSVVESYFSNQAMGMSLEYGLKASLNSIGRMFEEKVAAARIGGESVYNHLHLLDRSGELLISSPADFDEPVCKSIDLPWLDSREVRVISRGNGKILLISPVFLRGRLQGYVLGCLNHGNALDYLISDLTGPVLLLDEQNVVYQSHPELSVAAPRLRELTVGRGFPHEVNSALLAAAESIPAADVPLAVFTAAIPDSPFALYLLEKSDIVGGKRTQLVFKVSMVLLTAGAFLVGVLFLRAGSRNLVLETFLKETEKQKVEASEKAEELELLISGASLGTWKWDIPGGEVTCNRQWVEILGLDPGEKKISIERLKAMVHPDERQLVFAAINDHLQGDKPFYFRERRLRHAAGHWVWVRETGKILKRDAAGKALYAFGILQDITEEKNAARLLQTAKEEADLIIRRFLDTLIVIDTGMRVVRINEATCRLLGQAEEELLGRDVAELFHDPAETIHEVFSYYRRIVQAEGEAGTEELRNVELCYRDNHGGRLPMSFNLSLLKNDSGEVGGVVAAAKDISKIRQVVDQLAQQKEYIEALFDIVPEGLLALSPDNRIVTSNQALAAILDDWGQRMPVTEDELQQILIDEVITGYAAGSNAFTFALRAGETAAYCKCHAVPIAGLAGIALLVSLADITAERAMQEEMRLLATIIEQTGDSVIITGTDKVIRYANPAASSNSGYSREELLGKTPTVFKSGLVDNAVYVDLYRTLEQGQVWSGRLRNRQKNGAIVEEDVTISPMHNEDGQLSHYVAIKRDMTEMTNLQLQLLQAQKLEAIGTLAAGIAHEINTPMQYVQNNITFFAQAFSDTSRLFTELARTRQNDNREELLQCLEVIDLDYLMAEIPEAIDEAREGIDRVVKIVSAMKAFSHPGSSDRVAADINLALENTVTVCRNEYKYVAEMVLDLQADLPNVPCFPDQLNQAMLNLIVNAAHAIEESGAKFPDNPGRITISTRNCGDTVEIRVQDSGKGIPEKIRSLIYDPFFTTKEVGKGTGQGLTIVYDINFITEPGMGTTFIVRLPTTII
jgi:PAS domain S-box-containing protein